MLSRDRLRCGLRKMLLVARVEGGLRMGSLRRRHMHHLSCTGERLGLSQKEWREGGDKLVIGGGDHMGHGR